MAADSRAINVGYADFMMDPAIYTVFIMVVPRRIL
jgi:hypothetical protein